MDLYKTTRSNIFGYGRYCLDCSVVYKRHWYWMYKFSIKNNTILTYNFYCGVNPRRFLFYKNFYSTLSPPEANCTHTYNELLRTFFVTEEYFGI